MIVRDIVVACIALGLGSFLICASVANHEKTFQIRTPSNLSQKYGRNAARMIVGFVGAIVAALGFYILMQPYLFPSSKNTTKADSFLDFENGKNSTC